MEGLILLPGMRFPWQALFFMSLFGEWTGKIP